MKKLSAALILATALSACSPHYDWRDYRSNDAPYSVLFPGKPASQTRNIALDTLTVSMTMTAAEVNGVIFAVGSAQVPEPSQAGAAIVAMKTALLNNMGASAAAQLPLVAGRDQRLDVDARGSQNGQAMRLIGRFIARERRVYQVIIMGRDQPIAQEAIDTYLSSFTLNGSN